MARYVLLAPAGSSWSTVGDEYSTREEADRAACQIIQRNARVRVAQIEGEFRQQITARAIDLEDGPPRLLPSR